MISIETALAHVRRIAPLTAGTLPIADAFGHTLASEVLARTDLPPFPQSAMDGYAVRAEDLSTATSDAPATLRVVGVVAAGPVPELPTVGVGECTRIFTGAHLPPGADTIVRQEDTVRDGEVVRIAKPITAGTDLRLRGEELRDGTRVADAGQRLTPGLVAAISMAGVPEVSVRRQPRVAVFTTGDEVRPPGQPLVRGQVYDANAAMIRAWLRSRGVEGTVQHLPDTLDGVTTALDEALSHNDLVLTTGGVSVGDRDFVIPASKAAGATEVFWKVAQKPGKPFYMAQRGAATLLGFPGNPGAVFAGLQIYADAAIVALAGGEPRAFATGVLAGPAKQGGQRDKWTRCTVAFDADGRAMLTPLEGQASHMIANLALCDAIVRVPAGKGALPAGTLVAWTPVLG